MAEVERNEHGMILGDPNNRTKVNEVFHEIQTPRSILFLIRNSMGGIDVHTDAIAGTPRIWDNVISDFSELEALWKWLRSHQKDWYVSQEELEFPEVPDYGDTTQDEVIEFEVQVPKIVQARGKIQELRDEHVSMRGGKTVTLGLDQALEIIDEVIRGE